MRAARAAHQPATSSAGGPARVPVLPAGRLGRGPGQGGLRILAEHGAQGIAPLADPVAQPGLARAGRQAARGSG